MRRGYLMIVVCNSIHEIAKVLPEHKVFYQFYSRIEEAIAVEKQINTEMIVAVDEHTGILIDETNVSHCGIRRKLKPDEHRRNRSHVQHPRGARP